MDGHAGSVCHGGLALVRRKAGRLILKEAEELLKPDPLAETRNNKALRPNPMAQRELRLSGKYRILYNVDAGA